MSNPDRRGARPLRRSSVLVLASLAVAACKPQQGPPAGGMPPPPVSVVTVQPESVPAEFEYVGQTAGSREVEVRARVAGILQKRNYTEGATVKAGQSLFTIDPAPFEAALARAEADVAAAQARHAQAEREAKRLAPLLDIKAVSQKDVDDAASAAQIAAAEEKSARARLQEARLNLAYTRVESPIGGVAARALRSEGNLVSGPDVLLTTVVQVDPIHVIFGIPDNEHLQLRQDVESGRLTLPKDNRFEVTLKLADGTVYSKPGRLTFADVRINASTGTSEARAELPNAGSVLRPGQFVRVRLSGALRPNAIRIPQRAVLEGPQGKFVYVVNAQSKAEPRPVELGPWSGDAWLINAGLKPGEKVIVDGVMKVGPGAPVSVAPPAPPPGEGGQPPAAAQPRQ